MFSGVHASQTRFFDLCDSFHMVVGRDLQNLLHLLCLSAMLELSFFQLSPTPTLNEAFTNEVIPAPP